MDPFAPVTAQRVVHALTRPSLSYWQDAWIRLRRNRRAFYSLYLVLALLVFTVAGPWVWPVDPARQDLDQVSQPPGASRVARIVAPYEPWSTGRGVSGRGVGYVSGRGVGYVSDPLLGVGDVSDPSSLVLAEPATTQAVRLLWSAVPEASGYRVYRNVFPPRTGAGLGLPLAEVYADSELRYEDRLDLEPQSYWYSIVSLDRLGAEIHDDGTPAPFIAVTPERVITAAQAVERGLAASESALTPGTLLTLTLHPLGTDYLGRDMLARLMHGARVSLFIGIVAPALYVLLGVLYGSVAGFLAGTADQYLMRFADFVVALPFLLFMILFKIAFGIGPGESGILPMLVALVLLSWPATARLVRGQILQIRQEAYVGASRLLGAPTGYLVWRHMIPNTFGVILVTLTFAVPSAIFTEAFLSFIGMGVAPPTPSWGSMCNEGIKTMLTHPHELVFPALFISVTVLAFNLLGDGLRDALDARMRSRE
jgi:oligopeptide transport system permease protein